MNSEYAAKMLELLEKEPDHMYNIMKKMNQRGKMKGCRPGKAPLGLIKNAIKNDKSPREEFYRVVMEEYFPDEDPKDENADSMKEYADRIVGRMASFALKGKEEEFPMRLVTEAESGNDRTGVSEAMPKSNISDDTKGTVAETPAKEVPEEPLTNEKDNKNENETEPKKTIQDFKNLTTVKQRRTTIVKTKYLGSVQTIGTFYNFYPYAIVGDDGSLTVLDNAERKEYFPSRGNINIYNSDRYSNLLGEKFVSGAYYILELPDEKEENLTRDGNRNQTNYKVDVNWLVNESAIHDPDEYGIYPVVEVSKLEEKLSTGIAIQLDNTKYGFTRDEQVLLGDGLLLIGPCTALLNSGMIATGLLSKNYVLDAYIDNGTGVMHPISVMDNGLRANYITFACIKDLPVVKKDYISDEMLIKEYKNIVDKEEEEYVSIDTVLNSLFSDLKIPEAVVKGRRERLLKILGAQGDIQSLSADVADLVNKMLLKAAGENDDAFREIFEKLAEDPDFLSKFQRNQYIKDALDMVEDQLDDKRKELEDKQKELDETEEKLKASREKLANERAVEINEEITQKTAELEKVNKDLEEALAKQGLVNDIHKMEIRKGVIAEMLQEAEKKKDVVDKNIGDALKSFEEKAKNPIDQIVSYLLNDQVVAAVGEQIRKAGTPKEEEKDSIIENRSDFYLARQADAPVNVSVDELCERIKKYRGHYSKNDIINLYLCLANSFLTVFSGAPGTGKTSICTILAHALGLDSFSEKASELWEDPELANRFAVVSVERGWSSKRDLIGYYNPLTKSFDKANPSMYQALEMVNYERNKGIAMNQISPYMVLLDEANLSPMEYYWADFMAVCDRMSSAAPISLGEDKTFRITEALRFVATINNDFTTESLSPRLIDRAWVVSLPQPVEASDSVFDDVYEPVSVENLKELFAPRKGSQLTQASLELLKEISEFCKKQLSMNISSRTDIAIKHYCMAGEKLFEKTEDGTMGVYVAIDYAVAQKILPAIRGSGEKYREKLVDFRNLLQRYNLVLSVKCLNMIIETGDNNMMYFQYFA